MSDFRQAPMSVDPYKPNSARIYNYMLGGKDYYEVDLEYAERVLKVAPDSKALAQMSRRFLLRGVRAAAEAGVRQFIDVGAGIPISPSVYEVARAVDPSARVVSIDFDPVVFAHATASSPSGDTPMLADLRHPDTMIDRLAAETLIDFDQPVAFLIVGVLHFIMDDEQPADIIARLGAAMASGSHLILTHASIDSDSRFIRQAVSATKGSTAVPSLRSRAEIGSYLAGFTIRDPGLAPIQDWLDDDSPATRVEILGGICRKP